MKTTQNLRRLALALAAIILANSGLAGTTNTPAPRINISGALIYNSGNTNDTGTVSKGSPNVTVAFNNQRLIALLNASPIFRQALTNETGDPSHTNIEAGSYIIYYIYDEEMIITNKDGLSFNLDNNKSSKDFGYIQIDYQFNFGDFTLNDATHAGSEIDEEGIYFYFHDYNGNDVETYGQGTLAWVYGPTGGGASTQKATVTVSLAGGAYFGEVNGFNANPIALRVTGTGSNFDPSGQAPYYKLLP